MKNTARVDKELFEGQHYLGKPADADDLIIERRIRILKGVPDFIGKELVLLEIGCGNGNTLLKLAGEYKSAIGLEYVADHKQEFDLLKKKLNAENAEFLNWDIMEKPYFEPADRLISFEVIEHLPHEDGVEHYFQSVNPGALCAFTVPNKWWVFETHGAKLPLLPWNRVPFFSWLPKPIHERYANARIYTKNRISKLLQKHGFVVNSMVYVTAPMDVIKWKPLRKFLRKYVFNKDTTIWPFKAVSIFIVAEKGIK